MKRGKNKGEIHLENVVFIVLNTAVILILMFFVYSKFSQQSHYEELYSKKIALLIDNAEPGMVVSINVSELNKKNDLNDRPIEIDFEERKVITKLSNRGGYEYYFFSDIYANWGYKDEILELQFS